MLLPICSTTHQPVQSIKLYLTVRPSRFLENATGLKEGAEMLGHVLVRSRELSAEFLDGRIALI